MFLAAPRGITILHVSDTHIAKSNVVVSGSHYQIDHPGWQNLSGEFAKHDACIVTGDLCEPSPSDTVLRAIRAALEAAYPDAAELPWLVVPGNHDRRKLGNFGLDRNLFETVFSQWNRIWWSLNLPIILIPLDSNPDSKSKRRISWAFDLARGCLGEESSRIKHALDEVRNGVASQIGARLGRYTSVQVAQILLGLAGAFTPEEIRAARGACAQGPALSTVVAQRLANILADLFMARAVRCVLMHHHPVGIVDTENLGLTSQEAYLTLTDAGRFISEAIANKIDLVCHGHKHMPHRTLLSLPTPEGAEHHMAVVGCGSSTATGPSLQATANLIHVSSAGEVDVRLKSFAGQAWAINAAPLKVRSWSNVKIKLSEAAAHNTLISAGTCNVTVNIISTGDAVISVQWNDIIVRPEAIVDGHVWIPLSADCDTHVLPPEVMFLDRALGAGRIEGQHVNSMGRWHGFLVAPLTSAEGINRIDSVEVRYSALCAFFTDSWQQALVHPEESSFRERYTWSCDIPVRERLTILIQSADASLRLERPLPICETFPVMFDGLPSDREPADLEKRNCSLVRMIGEQDVVFATEKPLWGYSYGAVWTWRGKQHDRVTGRADLLNLIDGRRSDIEQILCEDESIELAFFSVGEKGRLAQLAQNKAVISAGHHTWETRLGVGVAGRAAFLGQVVAWDAQDENTQPWYIPPRHGGQHAAIIGLPLVHDDYGSVAVLCASEAVPGPLARAVGNQGASTGVVEDGRTLERLLGIAKRVAALFLL